MGCGLLSIPHARCQLIHRQNTNYSLIVSPHVCQQRLRIRYPPQEINSYVCINEDGRHNPVPLLFSMNVPYQYCLHRGPSNYRSSPSPSELCVGGDIRVTRQQSENLHFLIVTWLLAEDRQAVLWMF